MNVQEAAEQTRQVAKNLTKRLSDSAIRDRHARAKLFLYDNVRVTVRGNAVVVSFDHLTTHNSFTYAVRAHIDAVTTAIFDNVDYATTARATTALTYTLS
jgi:hypothetical protein